MFKIVAILVLFYSLVQSQNIKKECELCTNAGQTFCILYDLQFICQPSDAEKTIMCAKRTNHCLEIMNGYKSHTKTRLFEKEASTKKNEMSTVLSPVSNTSLHISTSLHQVKIRALPPIAGTTTTTTASTPTTRLPHSSVSILQIISTTSTSLPKTKQSSFSAPTYLTDERRFISYYSATLNLNQTFTSLKNMSLQNNNASTSRQKHGDSNPTQEKLLTEQNEFLEDEIKARVVFSTTTTFPLLNNELHLKISRTMCRLQRLWQKMNATSHPYSLFLSSNPEIKNKNQCDFILTQYRRKRKN